MTAGDARVAFDNLHALARTAPLVQALGEQGVPVMLLKGAALLTTVYERLDERPMSDVDLLIRPEHATRALEILTARGCREGRTLVTADFFPRFYYERELFTDSSPPVRLDLHVRPFRPLPLARVVPDDGMWEGARRVDLHGAAAWVPSPELFLIHLAGHAAFHGFTRVRWLADIRQLIVRSRELIDWDHVVRTARCWRLTLAVREALRRTITEFSLAVPSGVMNELTAHRAGWGERWLLRQAPYDAASPLLHVLTNLVFTPGLGFRCAYLRRVLFPEAGDSRAEGHPNERRNVMIHALRRGLRAAIRSTGLAA